MQSNKAIFQNDRQIFTNIHIRPVFEDKSCCKMHYLGFHGRGIDCNENKHREMSRSPYDWRSINSFHHIIEKYYSKPYLTPKVLFHIVYIVMTMHVQMRNIMKISNMFMIK